MSNRNFVKIAIPNGKLQIGFARIEHVTDEKSYRTRPKCQTHRDRKIDAGRRKNAISADKNAIASLSLSFSPGLTAVGGLAHLRLHLRSHSPVRVYSPASK